MSDAEKEYLTQRPTYILSAIYLCLQRKPSDRTQQNLSSSSYGFCTQCRNCGVYELSNFLQTESSNEPYIQGDSSLNFERLSISAYRTVFRAAIAYSRSMKRPSCHFRPMRHFELFHENAMISSQVRVQVIARNTLGTSVVYLIIISLHDLASGMSLVLPCSNGYFRAV
jgi:hypothetical protein